MSQTNFTNMKLFSVLDYRNSFIEGMFANAFATLTGGVFLTGFALHLQMSEVTIGLLAGLPFAASILQLPASTVIETSNKRKKIAAFSALLARLMWFPILIVGLTPLIKPGHVQQAAVLTLIFTSHAFASVSYVSWASWIFDLVPPTIRGRFFGTRNMLCGAAGITVTIIFGNILDLLEFRGQSLSFGYTMIFGAAVLLGLASIWFVLRISEVPYSRDLDTETTKIELKVVLTDKKFRRFLLWVISWNLSVHIASPFFTLYFLREMEFSYGFVATLAMLSAFADLLGMHIWGHLSDRVHNKVIIRTAGWGAVLLPLAWVFAKPESLLVPIGLHILGGLCWAGVNLCITNFMLGICPPTAKTRYLSVYNFSSGVGAFAAPIITGFSLESFFADHTIILSRDFVPLQVVFIISSLMRFSSLMFFKYIPELHEVSPGELIRIIRGVRGLNGSTGFNNVLHPVVELGKNKDENNGKQ